MLLGVVLLYVGAVLAINGIWLVGQARAARVAPATAGGPSEAAGGHPTFIENREIAILNIFTGVIGLVAAITLVVQGNQAEDLASIRAAGYILLFAFTYLWVAYNQFAAAGGHAFGWYCLFVAITAVAAGIYTFSNANGNDAVDLPRHRLVRLGHPLVPLLRAARARAADRPAHRGGGDRRGDRDLLDLRHPAAGGRAGVLSGRSVSPSPGHRPVLAGRAPPSRPGTRHRAAGSVPRNGVQEGALRGLHSTQVRVERRGRRGRRGRLDPSNHRRLAGIMAEAGGVSVHEDGVVQPRLAASIWFSSFCFARRYGTSSSATGTWGQQPGPSSGRTGR